MKLFHEKIEHNEFTILKPRFEKYLTKFYYSIIMGK